MKTRSVLILLGFVSCLPVVVSGIQVQSGAGAPKQTANIRPDLVTVERSNATPVPGNVPTGILADVKKMLDAGTGDQVIVAYIENWPARYNVTADDILRLHETGASADILTALIRRSGELREQATQRALASTTPPPPAPQADSAPGTVYQYPPSYSPYTYSQLYPSAAAPYYYYNSPYYYYNYWWYRYPTFSYGYTWPFYPFYSSTFFSRPFHKFGHHHGFAHHKFGHYYHRFPSHSFHHVNRPAFHHGKFPAAHHSWRSSHPWRSPGVQPWRPAVPPASRSPGVVHQFRSPGSVGFRQPTFVNRGAAGAPRMGFVRSVGSAPRMGFPSGGAPRMGPMRGGGGRR